MAGLDINKRFEKLVLESEIPDFWNTGKDIITYRHVMEVMSIVDVHDLPSSRILDCINLLSGHDMTKYVKHISNFRRKILKFSKKNQSLLDTGVFDVDLSLSSSSLPDLPADLGPYCSSVGISKELLISFLKNNFLADKNLFSPLCNLSNGVILELDMERAKSKFSFFVFGKLLLTICTSPNEDFDIKNDEDVSHFSKRIRRKVETLKTKRSDILKVHKNKLGDKLQNFLSSDFIFPKRINNLSQSNTSTTESFSNISLNSSHDDSIDSLSNTSQNISLNNSLNSSSVDNDNIIKSLSQEIKRLQESKEDLEHKLSIFSESLSEVSAENIKTQESLKLKTKELAKLSAAFTDCMNKLSGVIPEMLKNVLIDNLLKTQNCLKKWFL